MSRGQRSVPVLWSPTNVKGAVGGLLSKSPTPSAAASAPDDTREATTSRTSTQSGQGPVGLVSKMPTAPAAASSPAARQRDLREASPSSVQGAVGSPLSKRPTPPAAASSPAVTQQHMRKATTSLTSPQSVQGAVGSPLSKWHTLPAATSSPAVRKATTSLTSPQSVQFQKPEDRPRSVVKLVKYPVQGHINGGILLKSSHHPPVATFSLVPVCLGTPFGNYWSTGSTPARGTPTQGPVPGPAGLISKTPTPPAAVSSLVARQRDVREASPVSVCRSVQTKPVSEDKLPPARPSSPAIIRRSQPQNRTPTAAASSPAANTSLTSPQSVQMARDFVLSKSTTTASSSPDVRQQDMREATTSLTSPQSVQKPEDKTMSRGQRSVPVLWSPTNVKMEKSSEDISSTAPPSSPAVLHGQKRTLEMRSTTDAGVTQWEIQTENVAGKVSSAGTPSSPAILQQSMPDERLTSPASVQSQKPEDKAKGPRGSSIPVLWSPTMVKGAVGGLLSKRPTPSAAASSPDDTTTSRTSSQSGQLEKSSEDIPCTARPTSPSICRWNMRHMKRRTLQGTSSTALKRPKMDPTDPDYSPAICRYGRNRQKNEAVNEATTSLTSPQSVQKPEDKPKGQRGSSIPVLWSPINVKGAVGSLLSKRPIAPPDDTREATTSLTSSQSVQMEKSSEDISSTARPSSPSILRRELRGQRGTLERRSTTDPTTAIDATTAAVKMEHVSENVSSAETPSSPAILQQSMPDERGNSPASVQMEIDSEDRLSIAPPLSPTVMQQVIAVSCGKSGAPQGRDQRDANAELTLLGSSFQRNQKKRHQQIRFHAARGNYKRMAHHMLALPELYAVVEAEVLKRMQKECASVEHPKFGSRLRKHSLQALKTFNWDDVVNEWRVSAPTFLKFLQCAASLSFDGPAATTSEGRAKKRFAAFAGALLFHARSRKMCAAQVRNSLLLRRTGATKRCTQHFRKEGICVSYTQTLRLSKKLGGDFNDELLRWKDTSARIPEQGENVEKTPHVDESPASSMRQAESTRNGVSEDGLETDKEKPTSTSDSPTPALNPSTSNTQV